MEKRVWEASGEKERECYCKARCCIGCLCWEVNDPFHSDIREKSHSLKKRHLDRHKHTQAFVADVYSISTISAFTKVYCHDIIHL